MQLKIIWNYYAGIGIFISGKLNKCSVIDIPIRQNYGPMVLREESSKMSQFNMNYNQLRLKRSTGHYQPKLITFNNSNLEKMIKDDDIYFNCSSPYVKCGKIICNIGFFNTERDSGELQLRFSINPVILWNEKKLKDTKRFIFATEAWIDVIKPMMNDTIAGTREIINVTTTFYNLKRIERINVWIIVGSTLLGLITLFLIAIGLRMLGFFRRSKKDKLATLIDDNTKITK